MKSRLISRILPWITWALLFTAIYFIVGRLSLLLALPPGYATAIFPPAGFALTLLLVRGLHYWPAVWVGSYVLNIWVSTQGGGEIALSTHLTAAGIASGAALQAFMGYWLIRRFVGYPNPLNDEKDVLRFLFLGGPFSCLVNATLGPLSLYAAGVIDGSGYLITAATWWVGDSLGVLIMTPILLTLFGSPADVWRARRSSVSLPLLVTFALVTTLFTKASKWETQEIRFRLIDQAEQVTRNLENQFLGYVEVVRSIERLFATVPDIDRRQFVSFVLPALERHPGFQALEWAPRITNANRAAFEARLSRELGMPFEITEKGSDKHIITALTRHDYYPVIYLEPLRGNEQALGYDLGSNPARLAAISAARDSGEAVISQRITLVQEKGRQHGLLALQPVYMTGTPPKTIEARRAAFRGFAVGVFRIGDILDPIIPGPEERYFDLDLLDSSAPEGEQLLYTTRSGSIIKQGITLDWETRIRVGERTFIIRFSPTPEYITVQRGWQAWLVMAGGMLFISLLGAFLLSISGRAMKIQKLVELRTSELKETNALVNAIVTNAIEAIITITEEGIIESFNPAAETLFGYRAKEVLGRSCLILKPRMHASNENTQEIIATVWRDLVGSRTEITAQRKNGHSLPLEISVGEVRLGERRLYTGIFHDLSERKKVDRMKNEFISTVSHELRTPLTSIRGSLELVAAGVAGELPEQARTLTSIASENAQRLAALIDDILDIEKIEFDKISFNYKHEALMPIVKEAIDANSGFAHRHKVTIILESSMDMKAQVYVDKNRLMQVLNNLLSNAIKFSPEQGKVAVQVDHGEERVRVSVEDWGSGIPDEFRTRIFDKFAQADASDSRKIGGTGLGLSISKAIIEKMGGEIDYVTTLNIGSTFYFDLPLHTHSS